jgi:hypothetical protein
LPTNGTPTESTPREAPATARIVLRIVVDLAA